MRSQETTENGAKEDGVDASKEEKEEITDEKPNTEETSAAEETENQPSE